jgi:hypothetical protein
MAFYNSIDNTNNFVISFTDTPKYDFGVFAKGYYYAASRLAEDLLSKTSFSDYEAYPVVFLYRHCFELHLKNIIYKAELLLTVKGAGIANSKLYNSHRLPVLAEKVVPILLVLFPYDTSLHDFLQKIKNVANDFAEIDPDSYSYRYPIDTTGNWSTKGHQLMNLEALHQGMFEVVEGLDAIHFGIDIETFQAQQLSDVLRHFDDAA